MKKTAVLLFVLCISFPAIAQQKHMIITIEDDGAVFNIGKKPDNMFITRDDTAQVEKHVDLSHRGSESKQLATREIQLMQLIEPYYLNSWKLVSTSAEAIYSATLPSEVYRYYFIKEIKHFFLVMNK